jgi:hypothetical protein
MFGGGSLMVLECISWNGVGILAEVKGRMNVEMYVFILEDNMLSSMGNSGIPEENIIFQQDNKPENSTKRAQNRFKSHGIRLFDWPA